MTKEMQDQLQPFEIFIERMEQFVEDVKNYHLTDEAGNVYNLKDFDIRDTSKSPDSVEFALPTSLEEYLEIWRYVQSQYEKYLQNYDNISYPNAMFFDLYWNDVEANSAFYDNLAIWIYFDYEFGIYYEGDKETLEKIQKREEKKDN